MHLLNVDDKQNDLDITFYDRYSQLIYTYIRRQITNTQDAEDILLEVFIAALATSRALISLNKVKRECCNSSLLTLSVLKVVE